LALKFWLRGILFVSFGLILFQANGQSLPEVKDSIQKAVEKPVKKHIPGKATMYSAVLPGLGQIYNKKYYKVPIIYGGFVGLGYVIKYYNQYYLNFRQAYFDLNDNNPLTKSYEKNFPYLDYSNTENNAQYSDIFIDKIDLAKRKRDLYIIATVGFYLLNVLDANVDAHFMDFDISEDLTLNFEPFMVDPISNSPILGGHLVLNF
jgi:hypothetical protein